ncbi:hypothetical protein chiPu_0030846, partial [Chiloscyllium punctatum]|nr:hypothetical protein [Chiloscyllium punctatum]
MSLPAEKKQNSGMARIGNAHVQRMLDRPCHVNILQNTGLA